MPHEVVSEWLRNRAIRLDLTAGLEAATALDDSALADWANALTSVAVVGLGEATHGTAEFALLKSRLVRWLVERLDFGVLALEASPDACRALDAYVVSGHGDARSALRSTGYWVWSTEEMVPLLEWLRGHNADLEPERRVRIVGLDPVLEADGVERAAALVATHLPERATAVRTALTEIWSAQQSTAPALALLGSTVRAALPGGAARQHRVGAPLRAARRVVVAATDALLELGVTLDAEGFTDLTTARYAAAVEAEAALGARGAAIRDAAMADRVTDLLTAHPQSRVVVWAHNGHVADADLGRSAPGTGRNLRTRLGERYYALGMLFASGCFTALTAGGTTYGRLDQFCLPAPRRGGLEDQLDAVGSDLLVDLRPARQAAEPAVRRWARRRMTMRSYGSTVAWWPLLRRTTAPVRPAADFDGVVLVTRSTASTPVSPDGHLPPEHAHRSPSGTG